jgi:predicted mannosyl-3-phosphoglycerate phosphatase (HAD superfamily)
MSERTNMPELLNRFMETSNIAIKPSLTRLHRLIILRFVYSFGQSSNVTTCLDTLRDAGVNVGTFNHETIQVHSAISSLRLFTQNTSWN